MSKDIIKGVCIAVVLLCLYFASWAVRNNEIVFHVDIARDFLLVEDIVKNKPLTLIGPHTGGIPGVFHGPLWLYLQVPAFIIGRGNPVVIGWFWFGLYFFTLGSVYWVTKKLFSGTAAYLSTALTAVVMIDSVRSFFNPVGALIVAPLFFYFLSQYVKHLQMKHLVITLFLIGLLIQFQMAFGLPILILVTILTAFLIFKKQNWKHFLSFLILLIPLSTFILFDIKHGFLQTHAVLDFLRGKNNVVEQMSFIDLLRNRVNGALADGISLIGRYDIYARTLILLTFGVGIIVALKTKLKQRIDVLLFVYLYLGFWVISLLFKGVIWGYYFLPFLPLLAMALAGVTDMVNKRLFTIIFLGLIFFNLIHQIAGVFYNAQAYGKDLGSWTFNYNLAKNIYKDAGGGFGYFIISPDLLGYSPRYALNYVQTEFPQEKAVPFEKKQFTYLLISPTTNFVDPVWWKINQVHINKEPIKSFTYPNGFRVDKYELSAAEQAIATDPNIPEKTLYFR